jgi:hypothetical protein
MEILKIKTRNRRVGDFGEAAAGATAEAAAVEGGN